MVIKKEVYFFHQKSDGDLTNKDVWDEKINWMNKIQDLYVSSIQEII